MKSTIQEPNTHTLMKFEYMNFEGTIFPIVPIKLKGKE